MIRLVFALLFSGLLLTACDNEANESQETDAAPEDIAFTFHCEKQSSETGPPVGYSIYAIVEEYKVKLADIDTCTTILKTQYDRFQIPQGALAATGGRDRNFYALRNDRQIFIFQGNGPQEHPGTPADYKLLATYENGRFHFHQ